MSFKDDCHCGHSKEAHYQDPSTGHRWACLALHCNDCDEYVDAAKPRPAPPPPPPSTPSVPDDVDTDTDLDVYQLGGFSGPRPQPYRWSYP